jgi:hypothetical protein
MPSVMSTRGRVRPDGLGVLHAVTGTWSVELVSHAATRFRMLYNKRLRTKRGLLCVEPEEVAANRRAYGRDRRC